MGSRPKNESCQKDRELINMKTTKFSDCECGGIVSLVNEGSIKYPRLRISCDTCKNATDWHTCKIKNPEKKADNYKNAYTSLLKEWNKDGKFLNGLKYEYFLDVSYFDTYLVRNKKDRKFGEGWSIFSKADAIALCNILNYPTINTVDKDIDNLILFINEHKIKFVIKEELNDVYDILVKGIM